MPIGNIVRGVLESAEDIGRFIFTGGYRHIPTGMVFGRPLAGLRAGYRTAFVGGMPFIAAGTALMAATAARGHKVSAGAGALAAPAGTVVGGLVGGPLGALAGTFVIDPLIQATVGRGVQKFVEFGRNQRRLEFGSFADSEMAWTMRQRAAQEMSRSLLNARQILGREAVAFHQ